MPTQQKNIAHTPPQNNRLPNPASAKTYNVLSLDGGGSWALLQAMVLGNLFGGNTPGLHILQRFHTVVANSGGAIVAALLACNQTPDEIKAYFINDDTRSQAFAKAQYSPKLP